MEKEQFEAFRRDILEGSQEIFDYKTPERNHHDAFTVLGREIKKRYCEYNMPQNLPRVIAQMIDDGFLDSVIAEKQNLIKHQQKLFEEAERKAREERRKEMNLSSEVRRLMALETELEGKIEHLQKKYDEIMNGSTDPMLLDAMRSYYFIQDQTGDNEKAAKAFNSFCLGHNKDPKLLK